MYYCVLFGICLLQFNQYVKQQIVLELQRIQEDIKVVVVDDDCVVCIVSFGVVKWLYEYVNGICVGVGCFVISQFDG